MIRFLIDECLTPNLAGVAKSLGYEARDAVGAGLGQKPDPVLARAALEGDDIFVTNNARDFRRLYARFTRHPGLVLILPSVPMGEQITLFTRVIAFIEAQPNVIDQMVAVRRDGTIAIESWPPIETNP